MKPVTHNHPIPSELFLLLIFFFAPQSYPEQSISCCIRRVDSIHCNNRGLSEIPNPPGDGKEPTDDRWCKGYPWKNYRRSEVKFLCLQGSSFTSIKKEIFSLYMSLEEINLSDNAFQRLEDNSFISTGFYPDTELKKIDISHNKISYVSPRAFYGLEKLEHLDLGHNRIKSLFPDTFRPTKSLQVLNLDDNLLKRLNSSLVSPLRNLKDLSVNSNRLSALNESLPSSLGWNLRYISFNNNRISYITSEFLQNLPNLMIIDLSGNRLQRLPADTFTSNRRLYKIILSYNAISDLPEHIFSSLCHMKHIDIRHNNLTTAYTSWFASVVYNYYNETTQQENKPRDSVTDGNPWLCDCKMANFSELLFDVLNDTKLSVYGDWYHYLNIKCSYPDEMLVHRDLNTRIQRCLQTPTIKKCNDKTDKDCNPAASYQAPVCQNDSPQIKGESSPLIFKHSGTGDISSNIIVYSFIGFFALTSVVLVLVYARRHNRNSKARSDSEGGYPDANSTGNINTDYRNSFRTESDGNLESFLSDSTFSNTPDYFDVNWQSYSDPDGSTHSTMFAYDTDIQDYTDPEYYLHIQPPNPPVDLDMTNPKQPFFPTPLNSSTRMNEQTCPKEHYGSYDITPIQSNEEGYLEPLPWPPVKIETCLDNPNYAMIYQLNIRGQTPFQTSFTRPKEVGDSVVVRPQNYYPPPESPKYTVMKSLLPLQIPRSQSSPPNSTGLTLRRKLGLPSPYEPRDYTMEHFSRNPEILPSVKYRKFNLWTRSNSQPENSPYRYECVF